MRFWYIFLIFVLLSSLVSAQIEDYKQEVDLQESNSFHSIEIKIDANEINLILPLKIEDLEVFVDDLPKSCDVEKEEDYSILRCSFDKFGEHDVKISYSTVDSILKTGDNIIYKSEFIPVNSVEDFSYSLKLPLGFVVPEESEFFITPKPSEIHSDGRRVILLWEKEDVRDIIEFSVMMEPVAVYSRGGVWFIVFGLVILGIVFGVVYYFKKPKEEKIKYTALIENEKKIVDVLKMNKSVLWQKQIQIKTGFSKVKLTRVLQSLEKRGVIKKEPFGNTNKIHLVEK